MDQSSKVFCVAALVLTNAVCALAFPFAARSRSDVAASVKPVAATNLGSIDLGAFGNVSIADLVHYYIENPPAAVSATSGGGKKQRFQGC